MHFGLMDLHGATDMTVRSRRYVYAALWFSASIILLCRSLPFLGWVQDETVHPLQADDVYLALCAAVAIGWFKGVTILRRSADRALFRFTAAGDRAPFNTVFSVSIVALIAFMMGLGTIIRLAPYAAEVKAWVVGIIYPAVALGLFLGGVHLVRGVTPRERES